MANYCMHCGLVLHPDFGLCPRCDRERLNQVIQLGRGQAHSGYAVPAFAGSVAQPAVVRQAPKVIEKAEPVKRKRKHKSLLKILISTVMTVMLLGTCLAAMGVFSVRQATTEEALTDMAENAELSDLIALLGADAEVKFYAPIKDYILENTGIRVNNSTIDRVLEASELKYYLAEKAAAYARDLYDGTERFAISQKEIFTLLRANREDMEKVLRISLSDDLLGQMADILANQEFSQQIGTAMLKKSAPKVYYSLHFGLSYSAIAVLLAVAAIIFLAMLRLDFSLGILGGGTALAVTGGLFALPALLIKLSPALLKTLVGNGFLQSAIIGFLNTNLIFSLLIFSIGMAIILVRASVLMLCKLFR